jgi:hypothetical protein
MSSLAVKPGTHTMNASRFRRAIAVMTRSWDFQEARDSYSSTTNLGCGSNGGICR